MAILNGNTFDAMLKELYPGNVPQNLAMKRHPFLSMVKKVDDFEGDNLVIPVYYENPASRSVNFTTAQANAASSSSVKWGLSQMMDYSVISIDALTIRQSRSNTGAFVRARQTEIDMMLKQLGNSAAHALYRDGYGYIGRIITTGTVISGGEVAFTLENADDARNFVVGQEIVFATNSDGTTPVGTAETVTSVDEAGGIIGCTALHADIDNGDYIWPEGDLTASTLTKMAGLEAWIPLTTPSATLFFGVNRALHPTRLAGHRLNATGNSIEENILTLAEDIVRAGGSPDKCFISHGNFSNLVKGLGTKVEYDGAGGKADVGFGGVQIHTSAGPVMVHPDPDCPANRGYCLQMDSWTIHHLDAFPHIDTMDGNSALRGGTTDTIEVRARYWAQLACIAPGWNGVFAI